MLKITVLFMLLIAKSAITEKLRFDDYSVYKVVPENVDQIKILQNLQESDLRFDFWNEPVPSTDFVTIMSSPENKLDLESILNKNNIKAQTTIPNVQEYIDKETIKHYTRGNTRSMTWDGFYDLESINAWLDDLVATYPTIVSEIIGGISYEGRDIKGVKLSHGSGKKIIFVEGGIHAREWISPSSVCFILSELLTSDDEETVAAARDYDWYIFPVFNPDGYVMSIDVNRMWRKNTRPITATASGVDLNRNWNSNWLEKGSSIVPTNDAYAGPGPFSEMESRSLSEFLRTIGDQIDMYLSFHSYSQLLLLPFGNSTEPVGNYYDAMKIGRRAMGALSVRYGTQYVTGNIAEAIYEATGGSVDWVKEHLDVPLVYCYELRDRGTYGFIMPDDEILPNNLEVMDSILELIHQAKRFGYMNNGSGLQASVVMIALMMIVYIL